MQGAKAGSGPWDVFLWLEPRLPVPHGTAAGLQEGGSLCLYVQRAALLGKGLREHLWVADQSLLVVSGASNWLGIQLVFLRVSVHEGW